MLYKEDWEKTKERFDALWHCEVIDRCCVAVKAPKDGSKYRPEDYAKPDDHDELVRYFRDPEQVLKRYTAEFEGTFYGGEALPSIRPNWGESGCTIYMKGARYKYTKDSLWLFPIINDLEKDQLVFEKDGDTFKNHLDFLKILAEEAKGKFLLAMPDYSGGIDAFINVRGVENTLMDMVYYPDQLAEGVGIVRETIRYAMQKFFNILKECNDGGSVIGWFNTWARGSSCLVQCDHSALLSPAMFEKFSLPDLEKCCNALDYAAYHLDGDEQVRHLDMILSVKSIKMIQWTNVAGQPGVLNYIPVYRRIQKAGKALLLFCKMNEVETLLSELSPKGLYLHVEGAGSEAEARELIRKVGQWTRNV